MVEPAGVQAKLLKRQVGIVLARDFREILSSW
jgi:hypothetical protein